jgi:phosphonopyruvate decarboxylase
MAKRAVDVSSFYRAFREEQIGFFTGVPDSLLKDFCAFVTANSKSSHEHVIAANEGVAVALAAGYHLATKKIPCVYTQNSGFGNMLNPLLSLTHPKVYSIPMVLLIGWRGEPGVKDEPQHQIMGEIQEDLLKVMNMDYSILPTETDAAIATLKDVVKQAKNTSAPVALLVRKDTFSKYSLKGEGDASLAMNREQALEVITDALKTTDTLFVGTTGVLSRELYEIRETKFGKNHSLDFLCVGNMGHAGALATSIAAFQPTRPVVCLDGDGAMLMHLGSIANIANSFDNRNFLHICLNNGLHESVGGQPTLGFAVDFCEIAKAAGYKKIEKVNTATDLRTFLAQHGNKQDDGPVFLEVSIKPGVRADLGRPKTSTLHNKQVFMDNLHNR